MRCPPRLTNWPGAWGAAKGSAAATPSARISPRRESVTSQLLTDGLGMGQYAAEKRVKGWPHEEDYRVSFLFPAGRLCALQDQ